MNGNIILSQLPEMKSGKELATALSVFPEYNEQLCYESPAIRLMALSDLYKIYVPSQMSLEIYTKIYLALMQSLQKKNTGTAIRQRYENHKAIKQQEYRGIMGGSDSFSIIGCSGIGKSSAIDRAISLITENRIIEIERPCMKIIPCLVVQTPFDSSVKQFLLEILRKVDEELGSNYYHGSVKARNATTDTLLGMVSTIALNHIGLLICDEIQNVVNSKNGKNLVGMLTQLINNSGISICVVGTPESAVFFESALQLARRSVGLQYSVMDYDAYFHSFCKAIYGYQYVQHRTEITEAITEWLYEHSSGMAAVVVSLIHDAQEIAILTGRETLNLETMNEAYQKRLSLLHGYIQPTIIHNAQTSKPKGDRPAASMIKKKADSENDPCILKKLAEKAKRENTDIVELLAEHITVVEIKI